jgi:purine nucleosidase
MNDLHVFRRLLPCLLILAASLAFGSQTAMAQTPDEEPNIANWIPFLPNGVASESKPALPSGDNSILFLPLVTDTSAEAAADANLDLEASGRTPPPTIKLLVDTDPGVDDAVALTWLLTQHEQPLQMLGIVTVAGNTSVYSATNNALLILHKVGRPDVPVVMGAAAPLVQPLSKTTFLVHGPDGLWFLGLQNPQDISRVPRDASTFYCTTVAANPGLHVLALGPLTNIAQAVQQCPDTMKFIGQLTILGGAKFGGNKTPVAEFNFWQDPEAADIVLRSGLPIALVPLDAFTQATVEQKDLDKLFAKGTPTVQFLAPAIQMYADVQIANTGRAGIPDAVAAVVALNAGVGTRMPALVKMVLEPNRTPGLEPSGARGQSIMGLNPGEQATMIASDAELSALAERAFTDPNFNFQAELGAILMREPANAQVVVSVPPNLLTKTVFRDLTAK